jgi:uncharacterized protein (DUF169 family)
MKEWQELGKELRRFINPETFPVAIKILKDIGEIPSGTRTPLRDLKVKMAHCQAQTICRKYGWTIGMTREDLGCAISGHTYGWETANQEEAQAFLIRMNYAVILIYLNPAQLMRCLHGSTQKTGRPITSSFSGRAASCSEGVLGAFLDQLPKVIIPGNGDRVWATAQDHEMAYALPASHLKDLVEGLSRTHERGIRYPIPSFLRYQPEVGLTLPLTDIFKQVGEKMKKG